MKEKKKLDFIKIKNFSKKPVKKTKRQFEV